MSRQTDNSRHLRPCREVIQQLQWDPRFDLTSYDVHYEERFAGLRTIALAAFLAKSEIPWHRIRQISQRLEGAAQPARVIWDRDQRIDDVSPTASAHLAPTHDTTDTIETLQASPTYHSALVIIPPDDIWAPIQAIRKEHDSSFRRWMPHINVLYGFVPEEHMERAAAIVAQLIAAHQLQAFPITLGDVSAFSHRRSSTLWLAPDASDAAHPTPIHQLQQALLPHFPMCDEQARKSDQGYTPHLTIAKVPKGQQPTATQLKQALSNQWQPISFVVDHLYLIHRRGDEPFSIKHAVPLQPSDQSTPLVSATPVSQPEAQISNEPALLWQQDEPKLEVYGQVKRAWAALIEREGWQWLCEGVTGDDLVRQTLLPFGSHALGVAGPSSDLDLVCVVPEEISPPQVFADLEALLLASTPGCRSRIVEDAMMPALKLSFGAQLVEITCARLPLGLWGHRGADWLPALPGLPDADRRPLQGVIDAQVLAARLREQQKMGPFQKLMAPLKAWAQARGVDSAAAGYCGGFGWSVIAAWWCLHHLGDRDLATPQAQREALGALFGWLAAWDGKQPIHGSLGPVASWQRHPKRDRLPILTPCAPEENITRTITMSTARVLRDEWQRGHAILAGEGASDANWKEAIAPVSPASHPMLLQLTVDATSAAERAACEGWCKAQLVGALLQFEGLLPAARWSQLRPYPPQEGTPWQLGIGAPGQRHDARQRQRLQAASDVVSAWLRERWERWEERPDGCELHFG